jgi:predicted phosphoribosyltransferase
MTTRKKMTNLQTLLDMTDEQRQALVDAMDREKQRATRRGDAKRDTLTGCDRRALLLVLDGVEVALAAVEAVRCLKASR